VRVRRSELRWAALVRATKSARDQVRELELRPELQLPITFFQPEEGA
jgi:hypothetical protein